jgi:hypothetical protein
MYTSEDCSDYECDDSALKSQKIVKVIMFLYTNEMATTRLISDFKQSKKC